MSRLGHIDLDELRAALKQRGLDGWLVYDFHDSNPIARRLLPAKSMITRRVFLWLPAVGPPHLIVHGIDQPALGEFPGDVEVYTTWQELQQALSVLLRGRRAAMEISPENAVPYLDLVPHGVFELLTRIGVTLVPSAPLVTQFSARWSEAEVADHRRSAEAIAEIARTTIERTLPRVGGANEWEVQQDVLGALEAAGLETEDPPIVAFGPNSANPHYSPEEGVSRTLQAGDVMLLDLWARPSSDTVWADQTWMGCAGAELPTDVAKAWTAVTGARDAAVDRLEKSMRAGERVTGAMLDQTAREVITRQGFGEYFRHRLGHSIDFDLHGSGPHLDDFETHDIRELLPGVGFSIEPGIYISGRFGIRSEINVFLGETGPEVTPREVQRVMMVG
jgi:Xaa-Pro aminopeptidase